jgi:cardiolipin synthase
MSWWQTLAPYWADLLALGGTVLVPLLTIVTIAWILLTKKDSNSATAWCLFVFFLPLFGPLVFLIFGWQNVYRPLSRKRRHRRMYESTRPTGRKADPDHPTVPGSPEEAVHPGLETLGKLAERCGAFPYTFGNSINLYTEGTATHQAMLEAIRSAEHHIHLETFILQPDETGRQVLEALTERARAGIQVRLLYDAMGSHNLERKLLQPLAAAGGKHSVFLPLNPFRRRIQINMRNHRKILVVDGRVGFAGGMNIGDEYLGKCPRFGYWRDTHLRLEGPAVAGLQHIFLEDWDFAASEELRERPYFPPPKAVGSIPAQIIDSGPDREFKAIREIYFAAILSARKRVWIASPYFVPDAGLLDALCLAGYRGVDVRFLGLYQPDKWLPYFAARYYWGQVLDAGVKVYQYTRGMMHSKVVIVDGEWASVGSANMDMRSLHLNFEANCLVYSAEVAASLERAFLDDLAVSIRLDRHVFHARPLSGRLVDNACRLMSPVL